MGPRVQAYHAYRQTASVCTASNPLIRIWRVEFGVLAVLWVVESCASRRRTCRMLWFNRHFAGKSRMKRLSALFNNSLSASARQSAKLGSALIAWIERDGGIGSPSSTIPSTWKASASVPRRIRLGGGWTSGTFRSACGGALGRSAGGQDHPFNAPTGRSAARRAFACRAVAASLRRRRAGCLAESRRRRRWLDGPAPCRRQFRETWPT